MTNSTLEKRGRGRPRKVEVEQPAQVAPPENPIIKRGRGRPRKIPQSFNRVLELARIGMSDAEIQSKLDMSRSTWFRMLADDGSREKLQAIRVSGKDDIHAVLFERALAGDTGASRLMLEMLNAAGKGHKRPY